MPERTHRGLVRYRDLTMDNARWDGFDLRAGDIVISTPAKAGTTWMQMICVLLVRQPRRSGQWRGLIDRDAQAVYARRVHQLGGRDLVAMAARQSAAVTARSRTVPEAS
jgi:hypothetical protein